jgi:cell division protein FtsZ
VDALIVVSNDKLLEICPENTPASDSFFIADEILRQGVVGISEIIIRPGLVNVDFADVRAVMGNAGTALMGIGHGKGKNRAIDAARLAISSPLLDFPIMRAKGIVFNVVGGPDLTLQEINNAAEVIYANVDEDANIIFGALIDEKMTAGDVSITVLATGFPTDYFESADAVPSRRVIKLPARSPGNGASVPVPPSPTMKEPTERSEEHSQPPAPSAMSPSSPEAASWWDKLRRFFSPSN